MAFLVSEVNSEEELRKIYRLRYKVFCLEWGFEKFENYPDEMVTDIYDTNSVHFAVKDSERQKIIGAIMLILNSNEGFPTEKYCELDIDNKDIPRDGLAEISRLVIHRDFRRRAEDKYIYGPDEDRRIIGSFSDTLNNRAQKPYFRRAEDRGRSPNRRAPEFPTDQRRRHEVLVSLYKELYRESKLRNITHWYAVMTKGVVNLLDRLGLKFIEIGDPVDFNGIRTPYLGVIEKIEQELESSNPALFQEFTKDL